MLTIATRICAEETAELLSPWRGGVHEEEVEAAAAAAAAAVVVVVAMMEVVGRGSWVVGRLALLVGSQRVWEVRLEVQRLGPAGLGWAGLEENWGRHSWSG